MFDILKAFTVIKGFSMLSETFVNWWLLVSVQYQQESQIWGVVKKLYLMQRAQLWHSTDEEELNRVTAQLWSSTPITRLLGQVALG